MKIWLKSKMLWLNIISIAVIIIQAETGYIVSPESQVVILGVVNFVLRLITNEEIVWKSQ
jgi:hypothetical protein